MSTSSIRPFELPSSSTSTRGNVPQLPRNSLRDKPTYVTVGREAENVKLMSKPAAKIVKGFVSLFSANTFKKLGMNGVKIGAGIAGGVAIAIFAGPQIHAAFLGLAASSVFPPVAIAVGATLGAAILAFGIYKLVQWGKAKLKAQDEARAVLLNQNQAAPQQPEPPKNAASTKSSQQKETTASIKSKAPSSVYAPSVANSNKPQSMPVVPEMSREEARVWGEENRYKN